MKREWQQESADDGEYYYSGIYLIHHTNKEVRNPFRVYKWCAGWYPIRRSLHRTIEDAIYRANRHSEEYGINMRALTMARSSWRSQIGNLML